MKALILAAGRGTRVQPLTYTYPKPMMPIINKPVMEFLVEHLERHGLKQIMVNTRRMYSPTNKGSSNKIARPAAAKIKAFLIGTKQPPRSNEHNGDNQ